jgi:hypothetical protein
MSLQSAGVFFLKFDIANNSTTHECELRSQLSEIPEVGLTGFTAREGLTGGVTILRRGNYFGSWRVSAGELVWVHANLSEPSHFVASVDEAVRYTLLLILRNIETPISKPRAYSRAG